MKIADIETPAILIDEAIARRNIKAAQSYCDKHGIKHGLTLKPTSCRI